MSVSETLNRAADIIEERGWTTGPAGWYHHNADYPLCVEGAIHAALVEEGSVSSNHGAGKSEVVNLCPSGQALREYLQMKPLRHTVSRHGKDLVGMRLYSWNDFYAAGSQQVIESLRAAAVIEAAKEKEAVPA